jgi:thiaminase/transcriptional activator TenA
MSNYILNNREKEMSEKNFYEELRNQSDKLWNAIFQHPFVIGIGDGTLPQDKYEYYLKQDYVYLIDFSRVFALATVKAFRLEDMVFFSTLLNATLNIEMELHRKTSHSLGISEEELEKTQKSMITMSYTNLLVRTCYEGSLADIVSVLLPCGSGYIEIGQRLRKQGLPGNKFYQDWINTYSSKEFEDLSNWLIQRMNELAVGATAARKTYWRSLYNASARFEYLFFDMSWKKEFWPEGLL